MGWRFRWVSSYASDFNYDYHVSFRPEEIASGKVYHNFQLREAVSEERAGVSIFYKDSGGTVFHTYSTYARGDELLVSAYVYLDLTAKGATKRYAATSLIGSAITIVTTPVALSTRRAGM